MRRSAKLLLHYIGGLGEWGDIHHGNSEISVLVICQCELVYREFVWAQDVSEFSYGQPESSLFVHLTMDL
ncbi:hypothetical protein PG994_001042 [Apiospora phragmitis]|uniref:Uncharacterized protein n=1 Tax=Apiospora phragmitis TaxID=2905665 RepID=A0ABR1WSE8_9PEZI